MMHIKRRFLSGLLGAGLILTTLAACSKSGSTPGSTGSEGSSREAAEYRELKPEAAKAKLDEGGVVLVDVRTQEEYDEKHIPDALLIPLDTIGKEPPAELPDKDAEILLYCRSGIRAKKAAQKLLELGYTQVYNMGGITNWPYDTVVGEAK